ncbi:MAG: alpha/beta fold hydrolase [Alphaproteobacteria bacterium]|nr:alpha/beta fold hydrolase [Alphaproteobacteria bacterium]
MRKPFRRGLVVLFRALFAAVLIGSAAPAFAQSQKINWPNYQEGDFVIRDYTFAGGQKLPELKLHYRTLGSAQRNAAGEIVNGVLLLQGNTGTGANWLRPSLADELFKDGQPLDAGRYFIVIPDALGRGGSSKPSDGLKGSFPHYRYHDMVDSVHKLVTQGLKVAHIRLIIGSSLGCMHSFMWAEMYPGLMDGIVGLSCQPVEISGRNRIMRRAAAEAIRHDPDWNNGNYARNPTRYIYSAAAGSFMPESAARIQEAAPTRAAADRLYDRRVARIAKRDANDSLWAIEAIEDYSPEPDLPKITAKVLLINTVEDTANPPELGTVERAMKQIRQGRYVLIPYSDKTHGHFTHYYAAVWKPYLSDFITTLGAAGAPR